MLRHFMGHGGNVDDRHMTGPSSILVIGTMDTKAAEVRFLRDRIAAAGARSLVLDVSTSGGAGGEAEVTAGEVARHHPEGPDAVFSNDRGDAVAALSVALTHSRTRRLGARRRRSAFPRSGRGCGAVQGGRGECPSDGQAARHPPAVPHQRCGLRHGRRARTREHDA
jgi:hypothetical protein